MGQQQQQQSGGDNSLAPVWIMVLVLFSGYFLWRAGHTQIVAVIFYFNVLQASLIQVFIQDDNLDSFVYLMQTLDPSTVDFHQLLAFTEYIGSYVRYPVAVILLILCVFLYRSDLTVKYKKTHSMASLRKQEQKNWPAIAPVVPEDLVSVDISTGPWAMALTPMEFAYKYDLLKKNDLLLDNSTPGLEMTAGLRRGDAKRIFTLQLGPSWSGFQNAPFHVQAIAAVLMARINRDKAAANDILFSLDKSFTSGKLKADIVPEVLKKYEQTELVQDIVVKHAYLLTVLASLLQGARSDGVVPSAEFLWLKVTDRRLWYMLNSIGRQTPFAEVGGPFAHWRAEQSMGRSCRAPMIDEAIKALEVAVKEVKLTPKELARLSP
ncbi:MAG: type IVB secretion system coupling complex protein DotM/IcmP [Legionellaceae bacterium]|nr:type IVB secretion system coupling complex protein DotM/IcmP [Legionellaceae bacterium]